METGIFSSIPGIESRFPAFPERNELDSSSNENRADSPVFEIGNRGTQRRIRLPVVVAVDSREARLIQFSGGCCALLTEWAGLPERNRLFDQVNTNGVGMTRVTVDELLWGRFCVVQSLWRQGTHMVETTRREYPSGLVNRFPWTDDTAFREQEYFMARMIPPRMDSEGIGSERRIFDLLRDDPQTKDWTVLHSLGLARRKTGPYGEIDFVVIIPGVGIICLEVKGGRISCQDGIWRTMDRHGRSFQLRKSPYMQARDGMYALRGFVIKRFGEYAAESRCPFGCAVVFPDVDCPPLAPEFERY